MSITGKSNKKNGFTLVEVTIVMLIISIFMAIAVPRMSALGDIKLNKNALRVAHTIKYLYSQAAAHGKVVRLVFDLETGDYFPAIINAQGMFEPTTFSLFSSKRLTDGVRVKSFITIFNGAFAGDTAFMHFMPEGFAEKTVIVLTDTGGRTLSLVVEPLTGRVKIKKGEVGIDYSMQAA